MIRLIPALAAITVLFVACSGSGSSPTPTPGTPPTTTPQLQSPEGRQQLAALDAAVNDGSESVMNAACTRMIEVLFGGPATTEHTADGNILTEQVCAPALTKNVDGAKAALSRLKAQNP